jgi:hypothetical protein
VLITPPIVKENKEKVPKPDKPNPAQVSIVKYIENNSEVYKVRVSWEGTSKTKYKILFPSSNRKFEEDK